MTTTPEVADAMRFEILYHNAIPNWAKLSGLKIRAVPECEGGGFMVDKMQAEAIIAALSPPPAPVGRTGKNFREVGKTPRGYTIFVEDNEAGGHTYWSDEIDGGVVVWDTALVARQSIEFALGIETPTDAYGQPVEIEPE